MCLKWASMWRYMTSHPWHATHGWLEPEKRNDLGLFEDKLVSIKHSNSNYLNSNAHGNHIDVTNDRIFTYWRGSRGRIALCMLSDDRAYCRSLKGGEHDSSWKNSRACFVECWKTRMTLLCMRDISPPVGIACDSRTTAVFQNPCSQTL